jgi:hypothetical protein
VFVVELPGTPSFAFEATHEPQATAFASAPWFKEALDNYLRSRSAGLPQADLALRIRPATENEISVYRDFACEFSDMVACFLFAPVS